jgi:uncharacterized protein
MFRVLNETKGTVVAQNVRLADGIWSRFCGLMMRRSLPEGDGLLLTPSSSIHTLFMRFSIDVLFLDREHNVVKVVQEIKPYRAALSKGHSALELAAGSAAKAGVEEGDRLVLEGAPGKNGRR